MPALSVQELSPKHLLKLMVTMTTADIDLCWQCKREAVEETKAATERAAEREESEKEVHDIRVATKIGEAKKSINWKKPKTWKYQRSGAEAES